jgi:hypothetical protein
MASCVRAPRINNHCVLIDGFEPAEEKEKVGRSCTHGSAPCAGRQNSVLSPLPSSTSVRE